MPTRSEYLAAAATEPAPLPPVPPHPTTALEVLLERLDAMRPAWIADAACRGMDTELFFVERGESLAAPKAVCAGCPVRQRCLDFGVQEKFGIWGGLSERERRRIRKQRRRAA